MLFKGPKQTDAINVKTQLSAGGWSCNAEQPRLGWRCWKNSNAGEYPKEIKRRLVTQSASLFRGHWLLKWSRKGLNHHTSLTPEVTRWSLPRSIVNASFHLLCQAFIRTAAPTMEKVTVETINHPHGFSRLGCPLSPDLADLWWITIYIYT